jgi:hypothetical protein
VNLNAAFVPPAPVREALASLVAAQEPSAAARPETRRGLFGRRTPEATTAAAGPQLDVIDPDRLVLPITHFGFLASGDARRLVDALVDVLSELPPGPTVRVSGGSALIDPDDRSVWADLKASEDEIGAMRSIALAVVSGVQPLGFFCDRRQFRPRFPVATITDGTTVEHLEQVLAALGSYTSDPWEVSELAVMQRGSGVWRTVPIGP